ncbi:MAG: hypothetical protein NZ742_02765 [Acidobacteria bacterium]|nr:hypothetical protein [Acidobacteriota bacterium]MDW7983866.1 hypothetical protein [Acidobacteriota bacterium]
MERGAVEQAAVEYEGGPAKVMTSEYLIALFLRSGREKDLWKARLLWEQAEIDHRYLANVLNRHGLHEKLAALPETPDVR